MDKSDKGTHKQLNTCVHKSKVDQQTFNLQVAGSSPAGRTNKIFFELSFDF